MIRFITIFISFFFLLSTQVCADETSYDTQLKESGFYELQDTIPNETKDFLNKNELNPQNSDWVNNVSPKNVFSHIFSFLKCLRY